METGVRIRIFRGSEDMSRKLGGIVKRSKEERDRIGRELEESTRRAVKKGIAPVMGSSRLHWRLWNDRTFKVSSERRN